MDYKGTNVIIGLTGLIGSGKTTVANCFAKLGINIVDTDAIAHQLTMHGSEVLLVLANEFGANIILTDGSLNRSELRKIVFDDENARIKLESILHPQIYQIVLDELHKYDHTQYQIVVVPLLFRSPKYLQLAEKTIFVDSSYDLLLQRLWQRSLLDKNAVDAILKTQVGREEQIRLADDVIVNNGDIFELERQVLALHNKYLKVN